MSPWRTAIRSRSWLSGNIPPTDNAGGASVTAPAGGGGSNIGGGIAIGIVVALVIAGVAGALVYFLILRPKSTRSGYDNVDLDAKLGLSL
jgi:hypothetical protein